jgi:phage baseplate assembly protein V
LIDALNKMLAPLRTRVANMVSRAVVKLVDDSKKLQIVQIGLLDGETRDEVERFQQYGFTSAPKEGAEAVVFFVGGRRDHGLVLAVDDRRFRFHPLESGEVALYTDEGDSIVIKRGGNIEVTAAAKVKVAAPTVELAGNTESAIKGSTYRAAETTLNSTLGTSLSAAGISLAAAGADPVLLGLAPVAAAALAAAGASISAAGVAPTTFEAQAATFLSTKVKLS